MARPKTIKVSFTVSVILVNRVQLETDCEIDDAKKHNGIYMYHVSALSRLTLTLND